MRCRRSGLIFFLFAALFLASQCLQADQTNTGNAGLAAPVLLISRDARVAAMADAGVAEYGELYDLDSNPAGLADMRFQEISAGQNFYAGETAITDLSYGLPILDHAALGLVGDYYNEGSEDVTDQNGNVTGSINSYYTSFGLLVADQFFNCMNLGIQGNAVSETIGNLSATTWAGNLGLQYISPIPGLSLGVSEQNFGGQLYGFSLPQLTRAGLAYHLPLGGHSGFQLNADAQIPNQASTTNSYSVGAELRYGRYLALRGGYQFQDETGLDGGTTGVTAGLGITDTHWALDYAWLPQGDSGTGNQFSFTYKF